jgi:isocitrate/isopropylmalate dehydrogenase
MRWLGTRFSDERLVRAHTAIEQAVAGIVERGAPLTGDLGGSAGTKAVAQAVRDDAARRLGCS